MYLNIRQDGNKTATRKKSRKTPLFMLVMKLNVVGVSPVLCLELKLLLSLSSMVLILDVYCTLHTREEKQVFKKLFKFAISVDLNKTL